MELKGKTSAGKLYEFTPTLAEFNKLSSAVTSPTSRDQQLLGRDTQREEFVRFLLDVRMGVYPDKVSVASRPGVGI